MSFARLVDDIAHERDRRESFRHFELLRDRIRFSGRPFHKAIGAMTGNLRVIVKSMSANLAHARAADKESALERLAAISAEGNALAASGRLSAHEGALLDGAIARAADR